MRVKNPEYVRRMKSLLCDRERVNKLIFADDVRQIRTFYVSRMFFNWITRKRTHFYAAFVSQTRLKHKKIYLIFLKGKRKVAR